MSEEMVFEVRFRGQNSFEAGGDSQVRPLDAVMLSWRPAERNVFEMHANAARAAHDMLVQEGIAGREVDGVVPYVVEVCSIQKGACKGEPYRVPNTMLWQYAEQGAPPEGPWTDFEPSGVVVGS